MVGLKAAPGLGYWRSDPPVSVATTETGHGRRSAQRPSGLVMHAWACSAASYASSGFGMRKGTDELSCAVLSDQGEAK